MNAIDHHRRGLTWLAAAKKQPSTSEAASYAAIAAAHFAAATSLVTLQKSLLLAEVSPQWERSWQE